MTTDGKKRCTACGCLEHLGDCGGWKQVGETPLNPPDLIPCDCFTIAVSRTELERHRGSDKRSQYILAAINGAATFVMAGDQMRRAKDTAEAALMLADALLYAERVEKLKVVDELDRLGQPPPEVKGG